MPTRTETKPLTPAQQRAAQLLGQGWKQKTVAAELDTTDKSIQRWKKLPGFAALVKQARDRVLDAAPTAKATLESALSATSPKGEPDWDVRVKAASLLMQSVGDEPVAEERVTTIYVTDDGDA
jgi:transcriptional regulator